MPPKNLAFVRFRIEAGVAPKSGRNRHHFLNDLWFGETIFFFFRTNFEFSISYIDRNQDYHRQKYTIIPKCRFVIFSSSNKRSENCNFLVYEISSSSFFLEF
jgi:hypothetical protein